MELVTSLSIVSSAAASHATTCESFFPILKIPFFFFSIPNSSFLIMVSLFPFLSVNTVILALANLLGGVFVLLHNVSC